MSTADDACEDWPKPRSLRGQVSKGGYGPLDKDISFFYERNREKWRALTQHNVAHF